MKKLLTLLLLANSFLFSYSQEDTVPKLSIEEACEDIDFLHSLFTEAHIDLTMVTDTAMLSFRFDTLKAGIKDSISTSEFYVRTAPIFGSIRDIHCAFVLPNSCNDYYQKGGYYLPLNIYLKDSCIHVLKDKKDTLPVGAKILSINGQSAETIYKTLYSISASEGDNRFSRERIGELYFPSVYPLFFPVDSLNTLMLVDSTDTTAFVLGGIKRNESILDSFFSGSSNSDEDPFLFGYSSDTAIAYMKIGTFMGGNPGEYRTFLNTTFRHLTKTQPRCLILDVRFNGGGFADYGKLLVRHLMAEPFTYIDNIVSKSSLLVQTEILRESSLQPELTRLMNKTFGNKPLKTIWKEQSGIVDTTYEKIVKPAPENKLYTGFLVVMFNGLSASTTGMVCNVLSRRPNTLMTGEPAGCAVAGTFGQPTVFELPNSGIRGQISILRFNQVRGSRSLKAIEPDVYLEPYPEGFQNEDEDADVQLRQVILLVRSKLNNQ